MNFSTTKLLFTSLHVLLFLILFTFPLIGAIRMRCLEKERFALLKIKADLKDDGGWVSEWGTKEDKKDCCRWHGVQCDNKTNHIVGLRISTRSVSAKISPFLIDLVDLNYLEFQALGFNGSPIPEFMGSLGKLQFLKMHSFSKINGLNPHHLGNLSMLRHLDLSGNTLLNITELDWLSGFHSLEYLDLSYVSFSNIGGLIPHHLGNLSTLRHLDLRGNSLLNISDLDWLSSMHSLKYLDLSYVNLSSATTWMQVINNLPNLNHLRLRSCSLSSTLPPSIPLINTSTFLSSIDLSRNSISTTSILIKFLNVSSRFSAIDFSDNYMTGKIPDSLGNLTFLSNVDLSRNNLEGRVPTALWNSTMLRYLDLSENLLYGSLPNVLKLPDLETLYLHRNGFVGSVPDLTWCTSLRIVDFRHNMFNGTLTKSIGSLSKLQSLKLGSNYLEGIINEFHLLNLSQLRSLDLSFNPNLRVKINSHWNPPFKLASIFLSHCNLGPKFPEWLLKAHSRFASVDISNAQISDTIKKSIWDSSICFGLLNMSYNQISGIPPDLSCSSFGTVDLSSNEFNGSLPLLSQNLLFLILARNKLSETLTNTCNASGLILLDLSDNQLSGDLPNCLVNLTNLESLNFANNFLSGEIPKSLGHLYDLTSLHLRNNNFGGEIPIALKECRWLHVLDLGENNLSGNIPVWIGTSLPNLAVLSLKSNEFYGSFPSTLCHLQNLQLLDLSLNKISGTIPKCIGNFSSMTSKLDSNRLPNNISFSQVSGYFALKFYDEIQITWKGEKVEYVRTLVLLKVIDLSSNKFVGQIPPEVTSLDGLFALNISRNNLVGSIPRSISQLELLNFLDLSENHLSGHIPDTLSQLSHLGVLNLSFNNLSGRIPWNTHMQTFGSFSYLGNPELCGPPISKPCPEDETHGKSNSTDNIDGMDNDELITTGFYISMTLGFIFGFWGVVGTLILNKSCRHIWFKMLIDVNDWLCVRIAVSRNRLQRYFEGYIV